MNDWFILYYSGLELGSMKRHILPANVPNNSWLNNVSNRTVPLKELCADTPTTGFIMTDFILFFFVLGLELGSTKRHVLPANVRANLLPLDGKSFPSKMGHLTQVRVQTRTYKLLTMRVSVSLCTRTTPSQMIRNHVQLRGCHTLSVDGVYPYPDSGEPEACINLPVCFNARRP